MAKAPEARYGKVTDLMPDERNANRGTERGLAMLEDSLRKYGVGRGIVVDKNGYIIAGNKTVERLVDLGMDNAIIVPTDGRTLVVTQRVDLDLTSDPAARELAYADNRVGQVDLDFDVNILLSDLQEADLDLFGLWSEKEVEDMLSDILEAELEAAPEPDSRQRNASGVPDALFPCNNRIDIPVLDLKWQADALDQPATVWGGQKRTKRMQGTWLFYTEDYRYESLWTNPALLTLTHAVTAVEPNFSLYQERPFPLALWNTYRKRWIARYWQSKGIRIFVDLNVNEKYAKLNMLGVPRGWRAYATRGYTERLDSTEREFERAKRWACTDDILFVVYGGGRKVREYAGERNWIWLPEQEDSFERKGKKHG